MHKIKHFFFFLEKESNSQLTVFEGSQSRNCSRGSKQEPWRTLLARSLTDSSLVSLDNAAHLPRE